MHYVAMTNFPVEELEAIVAQATAFKDAIRRTCQTPEEHTACLERLFAESDLVQAVWPDLTTPHDVALGIVKGLGRLQLVAQRNGTGIEQKVASVQCRHAAEAEAMCQAFGDDRHLFPESDLGRPPSRQVRRAAAKAKR